MINNFNGEGWWSRFMTHKSSLSLQFESAYAVICRDELYLEWLCEKFPDAAPEVGENDYHTPIKPSEH